MRDGLHYSQTIKSDMEIQLFLLARSVFFIPESYLLHIRCNTKKDNYNKRQNIVVEKCM